MIDVVIIEDDEVLAELYKEICDDMNLSSMILNTSSQITAFIASAMPFKIGIFDLNLGIIPLDGRYLMDIFRFKGFDFEAIVVSGEITKIDKDQFYEKGIHYIMQKPVNFEHLTETLDKIKSSNDSLAK